MDPSSDPYTMDPSPDPYIDSKAEDGYLHVGQGDPWQVNEQDHVLRLTIEQARKLARQIDALVDDTNDLPLI